MQLNIKELKELMSKINLAVEKSKVNPKSGWLELQTTNEDITFKVSNYDYYLEATISAEEFIDDEDTFHVTVLAETFIPLISKLETETINICEKLNALVIETDKSSYTFPIIKELGKVKCLDVINFEATTDSISVNGNDLASVASINAKGLINALVTREIQQFIYVDNNGAITFTDNIYVNTFSEPSDAQFKMLLNITQAKLLEIFKNEENISISFEQKPTFETEQTNTNKVCIENNKIKLILITQTQDKVDRFPSIKLRALAENPEQTHAIIDRKALDKALARLMVFDKKFDVTVMDYSKIIFRENELELVSIKNKNFEKIPYNSSQNTFEYEAIVRFADLVNQLKTLSSKDVDISYGSRPALVLNGNIKQIIPEIRLKDNKV